MLKSLLLSTCTLIIYVLCSSCNFDDHNANLGNDYIFMHEGGGLNKIGKKNDGKIKYAVNYDLIIPHAVVDLAYNEEFILAVQVPDSVKFTNSVEEYRHLRDTSNHKYWIIESEKDIIHGPMTKNEYRQQRTKLSVPLKLQVGEGELELLREW